MLHTRPPYFPPIGFADCTVYWARVTKEVAKQVYNKEQLAPPSPQEWHQARKQLMDLLKTDRLKSLTKEDLAKGALVGIEISGFFLIGEMIGRRNVVGYNV
ncbi:mitochondrial ATP synthase g subunit-domain-containing protein [Dimargaris cristalligena]|uniref:Mitochondrial ATP synthase g subunit-domain-containing protein n=1 Tax=Dimargaris cristalligena TaxID=215637 RepID=A0A4V1J5S1_9FUNG|nr:mitochondrial ATP synthase g subunit-domain-containing protein [Dimargaris cristalligena]|eukprot:RKP40039.1 mitochondrial ATP synthase g subunit-domain-containing protein [Dimargaris cristalligena]